MSKVQRYHVITDEIGISVGHENSHGPWVSHQDHAESIAALRAEVTELSDEAYEYAEQLQSAERERDEARASLEVKRNAEDIYAALDAAREDRDDE